MTEKLYQADSCLLAFRATVTRVEDAGDGKTRVYLDRTAFYPESGGQPADAGTLGGFTVLDVGETDAGEVFHLLEGGGPAPGAAVEGRVDAARRFDHMQQHSGQHILSAAFWAGGAFRTVGFHLGADAATIDLSPPTATPCQVDAAFDAANAVVWEDRPVSVSCHDKAETAELGLRKPTVREGLIRVVTVADCDRSACGGTHVRRTGEVGMIAFLRSEKLKDKLRIHFACGGRAHRRFRAEHRVISDLCALTTTGVPELVQRVKSLQTDVKALEREAGRLKGEILKSGVPRLLAEAVKVGPAAVVICALDEPSAQAQALCRALLEAGRLVAAVVGSSRDGTLFLGRTPDLSPDLTRLAAALRERFSGKGGGRPDLAQVGSLDPGRLGEALTYCGEWLGREIGTP
ncbi:MAG: phosphoesterase [Acidobacteria bacterium]|nr:phosphoesterase [Acidobacteriota bacterium]